MAGGSNGGKQQQQINKTILAKCVLCSQRKIQKLKYVDSGSY